MCDETCYRIFAIMSVQSTNPEISAALIGEPEGSSQTSNSGKKEEAAVQNNLSPVIMNYCLDHSYHMDADVNVT